MLALTLKVGEDLVIDDGRIVVTLLYLAKGRARVGVTAARDIPVHRGIVQKRIDEEKGKQRERPCDDSSAS